MEKYVIALDQGTTSSRAVVFNQKGEIVAVKGIEFEQIYPRPGWVEHDPDTILRTQIEALRQAVKLSGIAVEHIAAVGITNQRETTVVWDRKTGRPVHNAIVWQCRRTAPLVEQLVKSGMGDYIRKATGLLPDPYFSGTKIKWLLDELQLHAQAERGELCFGTIDSFLAWNLITGRPHITDVSNASRTMLYNIHTQAWDEKLLDALNIPAAMLPEVVDTSGVMGMLDPEILGRPIPVASMAGDQQSALFGQACFDKGMMKNTYGTGCFLLMNTGATPVQSDEGLLSTIAWRIKGQCTYALEGSVFIGGAVVQWLRDEMGLIQNAAQSEEVAMSVQDNGGVYLVPAFTGLGAPYWDMYSRGTIVGLTRGTGRAHIVRAALESIAFQSGMLMQSMARECGSAIKELRVDGGASANMFLMQFQADILNAQVIRPEITETTALGAAYLAGLAVGVWESMDEIRALWRTDVTLTPQMEEGKRKRLLRGWDKAVHRSLKWIDEGD